MRHVLRALAVLGVAMASACTSSVSPPATKGAVPLAPVDHPEVLATLDSAARAWNSGDLDGYMARHVKSPELVVVGPSGTVQGWEEIRASYRRVSFPSGSPSRHVFFSDVRVRPVGPDRAIVHGMFQWLDPSTRERIGQGWMTLVVVRTAEGWKIAHRHNS